MSHIEDLMARRATTWASMQELTHRAESEKRPMSAEERASWDAAEADLTGLSETIERLERSARLEALTSTPPAGEPEARGAHPQTEQDEAYARAFGTFLKRGLDGLDGDQRQMMLSAVTEIPAELRAQSAGTVGTGGYAVPQGFWNKVTDAMKAYGGILGIANVITTDSGIAIPWPTADDTSNEGVLVSENTQMTDAADIAFAQNQLGAYMFSSKPIRASIQFIQDTAVDAEAFVSGKIGMRIGRALSGYLATGTGTAQPKGITSFGVGKQGTTGQTTSIIYDDLIDVVHSVNSAYRDSSCQWVMADSSLKVIRKLKDSQGRPLWEPSLKAGEPDTLLGYAMTIDDKMPTMAASAKPIAFGNFRLGYVVRRVNGGGLLRLTERYADYLQVGFIGFGRYDATIDDANAVRIYQNSAT